MIRYFKQNEIDIAKYDACIEASINTRIYAFSWYLDCVSDNWDVLVLNDYDAVMPLPWRQKYFIKYIYPPAWIQQLGVFSPNEISEKLVLDFINVIPKKFKKVTIQFNSDNKFQLQNVTERVNYILPLNKPYEEIYKGYRKDRKDRLKQVKSKNYIVRKINIEDLVYAGKKYYSYLKIKEEDYSKLKELSISIKNNNNGFLLGVYTNNNQFLGGSFLLKDKSRITYLFSVATEIGKKDQIISQVVNEIIEEHSNCNLVLDFEGSMIDGIASFYRSFGAIEEEYFSFEKSFHLF
ncbi:MULTISPECIES: hypothetical protein [Flavobacteriaceae]|uniref:GNAT family N-acetyltransferase n=2 Tax=Flavobacteriaceae TaxID=49546 RepID=A0A4Y8AQL8_9FLAO|nr:MULTISPECIES: hypothetical protein [Flavobacteriaceae]TEW73075.1 hypothetical protein E2488_12870 [Gramella jeungdoensis]GGK47214.1 hypothetical protein GCM10007963_14400 [Lutibacter litoralis]